MSQRVRQAAAESAGTPRAAQGAQPTRLRPRLLFVCFVDASE